MSIKEEKRMLPLQDMQNYVEENFDQAIEDLFKLIRIPTVTAKGGENSKLAISELTRIFSPLGFTTAAVETKGGKGQPVFTAVLDSNKPKTLLFYDHYDVQPAEPFDLWTSPPFEPEIREGKIYGRGVADNKGHLISRVYAVKMLQKLRGERDLPVNVKFVVEGEEEVSSPNLGGFVEQNHDFLFADQTSCIWEFGGKNASGFQEIWAGVKGICYVQLKTMGKNFPKKDLHSAYGAVVENPANHLVAALASLRDDKTDRILIRDYYDTIIPPSEELLQTISRIEKEFDEEKLKEVLGVQEFIQGLTGMDMLKKYYLNPTCTICGIWAGWQGEGGKTVLPAEAHAKLDFRLVPKQTPKDVINKLRNHFREQRFNVEIEWYEGYPAAFTPLSDPFVQTVKEAMIEVYNHEPILHPWSPGSGPLHLFSDYIPVLSIGVGNAESNAHSPNENIEVEDFKLGQICIARLMEKMA